MAAAAGPWVFFRKKLFHFLHQFRGSSNEAPYRRRIPPPTRETSSDELYVVVYTKKFTIFRLTKLMWWRYSSDETLESHCKHIQHKQHPDKTLTIDV
jgi:hypothetical protein